MKKVTVISMLTMLALIFSGVGTASAYDWVIKCLREFELYREFNYGVYSHRVYEDDLVEVRPGHTIRLYVKEKSTRDVPVSTSDQTEIPAPPRMTARIVDPNPASLGDTISLHFNPNKNDSGGSLSITASPSLPVRRGSVGIQIESVFAGSDSDAYPSNLFFIRVGIEDDDGGGGGTCNAAGLGFLALLLPLVSLFWKKEK